MRRAAQLMLSGVEIAELGEGRLIARMVIQPIHVAPNNFLHAASIIALADTACGYATIAHLPEGRSPSRRWS